MADKWLTVKEVADYLQVSTDIIYRYAQQGEIPVSKIGSQWRFKKEEIDAWMKGQRPQNQKRMIKTKSYTKAG